MTCTTQTTSQIMQINRCPVCGNDVDGVFHYGVSCCRSCASFFKRSVNRFRFDPDASYDPANHQCDSPDNKRLCKTCRFQLCLNVGMQASSVQQKRQPTGSRVFQKRIHFPCLQNKSMQKPIDRKFRSECSLRQTAQKVVKHPSILKISKSMPAPEAEKKKPKNNTLAAYREAKGVVVAEINGKPTASKGHVVEIVENPTTAVNPIFSDTFPVLRTAEDYKTFYRSEMRDLQCVRKGDLNLCPVCENGKCADGLEDFERLIRQYSNSTRYVELGFSGLEEYIREQSEGSKMREIRANDMPKLTNFELSGMFMFVENLGDFAPLCAEDQTALIKHYALRKFGLDHFYSASKHPKEAKERILVVNNYTYVPSDNAGIHILHGKEGKPSNFQFYTNSSYIFWTQVIDRFIQLQIGDAEIVFLHHLTFWSPLNHRFVSLKTQHLLRTRRNWALQMMFNYYDSQSHPNPEKRIADLVALFQKLEERMEEVSKTRADNDIFI